MTRTVKMVGYFWPDNGETVKDTRYFTETNAWGENENELKKMSLAEEACEHCWDRDGQNWISDGATVALVIDGEVVGVYGVVLQHNRPIFDCWPRS